MKRIAYRLLALSSAAILLGIAAHGRTRPRYGDTLRIERSADVSDYDATPAVLNSTVFETLVTLDDAGRLQPRLAISWTSSDGARRWDFSMRPGVTFHDGTPANAANIAHSLARASISGCGVLNGSQAVVFECESPHPNMPALLASAKYAIASVASDGQAFGTGPYKIAKREHQRILLQANDDYWGGRPYLDFIEILTGRNPRDQMRDFALDRADVIEVSSDQFRRAQQDRLRMDFSRPAITVCLAFSSSRPALRDVRLRQAISLAIDRNAIQSVIFQRQGEIAGAFLPNWLTGYEFLFATSSNLQLARQLRAQLGNVPAITVGYDPGNPLERLIAERIALNVRESGIPLQAVSTNSISPDIRIRYEQIASVDPSVALNAILDDLGILPPSTTSNLESLYNGERAALDTYMAIPLVHLPRISAVKDRVRNWTRSTTGDWILNDVWLGPRSHGEEHP